MNSEQYRQMLVRDGDRRFREWHQSFLDYQQRFQQAMAAKRLTPRPATVNRAANHQPAVSQPVTPEPVPPEPSTTDT